MILSLFLVIHKVGKPPQYLIHKKPILYPEVSAFLFIRINSAVIPNIFGLKMRLKPKPVLLLWLKIKDNRPPQ